MLILLVGVGSLAVYWTFYRPLPEYDATIQLPNLAERVEIYWGPYGVPHIYAENKHDLYMALGYVHAQDRLWQMTLSQLAAQGRFAEFFGKELVPVDKFQRTIGFWRIAQKMEARLPDSTSRILQAYSAGVNRYVAMNEKELPLQFALTGMDPIPWTPTHSLALARLLGWQLNTAWKMELTYTLLSKKLPPSKFNELFPDHKISTDSIDSVSADAASFSAVMSPLLHYNKIYKQLMGIHDAQTGSNAWAVAGSRTSSDKPLLAGDPHLGLVIPGKWYEVHLNLNGKNLSGATIPGAPAVVLGQNDVLAWSLTNVMLDGTDFYKEMLHPADSTQYLVDSLAGEAIYDEFEVQREVIKVKDADDIAFTRKLTKHGPVVSDIFSGQQTPKKGVITMKWIGQRPSSELQALQGMGWAESFDEFKEATRLFEVPGQNVIYADTVGNIALLTMARIPIRNGNPLLVRPGWKPEFDWTGTIPYQELPKIVNPQKGWVANANNPVVPPSDYPYYISAYWAPGSRYARIKNYLSKNNRMSVQTFQNMQYDVFSVYSRKLANRILPAIEATDSDFPIAVEYLKNWDYSYEKTEAAASIIDIFKLHLSKNMFEDEMGSQTYENFIAFSSIPARRMLDMLEDSSAFFNNINTSQRETKNDIIEKSMRQTITYLQENYGDEPSQWRWENLHTLTLKPPFFGQAAETPDASEFLQLIVENVMNKGPFDASGNGLTVSSGLYSWNSPYNMISGPSIRRIIDLSNTRRSLSILPTGQSGNPLSEFYGDQTRNWLSGQYKFFYQDSSLFNNYVLMNLIPEQ